MIAYLDAGSASMLVGAVAAGAAGVAVSAKAGLAKLRFRKGASSEEPAEQPEASAKA